MRTFDEITRVACYAAAAHLRSGPRVGLRLGECGERYAYVDGVLAVVPSAIETGTERTLWKIHDRLPWDLAKREAMGSGLWSACIQSAVQSLDPGWNMPDDPGQILFAHKGAAGWKNAGGYDVVGHFCNSAENALRMGYPVRAPQVAKGWADIVRQQLTTDPAYITKRGYSRETHWFLLPAAIAASAYPEQARFWQRELEKTVAFLLSKPLSQHDDTKLNDPSWPLWALAYSQTPKTGAWMVQAADWHWSVNGFEQFPEFASYGLGLAEAAYQCTGDVNYLRRCLPGVVSWIDSVFRDPDSPDDFLGLGIGRGWNDQQFSSGWFDFYRACVNAGLTDADLPARGAVNTYPMEDGRFVNLYGADLAKGRVSFVSTGGDTQGGRIRAIDPATNKPIGERNLEGPYPGRFYGAADYDFHEIGLARVTRAQVACFRDENWPASGKAEQVRGPITADPREGVSIKPGALYHVGRCYARLTGGEMLTFGALKDYVSFCAADGSPDFGLWTGRPANGVLSLPIPAEGLVFDVRGPTFARWVFSTKTAAKWEIIR